MAATYDLLDYPSTVTQPEVNGSSPVTTYVYDDLGEMTSQSVSVTNLTTRGRTRWTWVTLRGR